MTAAETSEPITTPLLSAETAAVARVRLRAQRRVLWLRHLWASGLTEPSQRLAIPHSEVDRLLTAPSSLADAELVFYAVDPQARGLAALIEVADRQTVEEGLFHHLRREFGLSAPEVDLLNLAAAMEMDPGLGRVYGYLHDDAAACYPTAWLAASLFGWPASVFFGPDAPLVRWKMARPAEGTANPWSLSAPWSADTHMIAWLAQGGCLDPALGAALEYIPPEEGTPGERLYPAELAALKAFVQAMLEQRYLCPTPMEVVLIAPEGAGKRTFAAQLCGELGIGLLIADAGRLIGPDVELPLAIERAVRAARMARLSGAALYWHEASVADERVWREVRGRSGLTFLVSASPVSLPKRPGLVRRSVRLPALTRAARIALWQAQTDHPVPESVAEWMLTPAEIANAALVAPAGPEAIVEACRQSLHHGAGTLCAPLLCPYTWDDIVLPANLRQHLEEIEAQARLRWPVYEGWGFGRVCPIGRSITALFAGPSGTGKTMAAQVIARSLGLELFRIDLAGVMSKYIGETEKNLKQIFDSCERANVVLFFDEADALFGQRTEVKDAHDRYANIEIDYLLQRMEQFDGIALLATNRKGEIDEAFLRRIRFIVDFLSPGPAERLALWKRALPARTPGGEELLDEIDWSLLANRLNMTGADIKGAALGAAFLARAEGTRIGMRHVLHAARREMAKHGHTLRLADLEG